MPEGTDPHEFDILSLLAWLWAECGIPEDRFWKLTPGKISAIVQARKERTKREDYRAGIVTATIRSALGSKHVDVFDDFPEYKVEVKSRRPNLRGYFQSLVANQKSKSGKS